MVLSQQPVLQVQSSGKAGAVHPIEEEEEEHQEDDSDEVSVHAHAQATSLPLTIELKSPACRGSVCARNSALRLEGACPVPAHIHVPATLDNLHSRTLYNRPLST